MKKTLSILLIAILTVSSIVGVSAAVLNNSDKNNTVCTTDFTEKTKNIPITEATNEKSNTVHTSDSKYVLPDLRGTWVLESNPLGRSVQVVKQDGNDLELLITAVRGNDAQIATARVPVSLETYFDGSVVRGTADFEYTDSFGNKGTGSVSASENVILLVINEEERVSSWGIANSTGDYIFSSNDINHNEIDIFDEEETDELFIPDLRGTWVLESNPLGRSVQVVKQDGNDLELLITAVRGNASQIATARVSVSLDTYFDGSVVRGTDDFEYTDSFGNKGTGSVSVSENVILLVINEEERVSSWGIANSTGDYIFSSNDINFNEYDF